MKNIWIMLLLVCGVCAFTACNDDEKTKEPELSDLVTDIKMPEKFMLVGADMEITGKGFEPSVAKLFLEDGEKKRTEVKDAEFTTTGVYFKTPETAGTYSVILSQDEREMVLGEIRVVEPVANLVMPLASVKLGEKVTVKATGLRTTAKIVLEDVENNPVDVEATITSSEVTFNAPSKAGYYTVILSEDGNDDVLGYFSVITKRVSKITQVMKALPMEGDEEEPYSETYSFAFQYADGLMKSIDFFTYEEGTCSFDYSEENKITVLSGGEEYATYTLKNGLVVKHSYDEEDYLWGYDAKGYLTSAGGFSFEIEDATGNLVDVAAAFQFEYGEDENGYSNVNPLGYLLYPLGIYQGNDMLMPYFLDKCGKHASKLPVKFSSDAYGIVGEEFIYTWDNEHKFITGVKFVLGEQEYTVTFEYED